MAHLEKIGQFFSSSPFAIRLHHPQPPLFLVGLLLPLWCFSTFLVRKILYKKNIISPTSNKGNILLPAHMLRLLLGIRNWPLRRLYFEKHKQAELFYFVQVSTLCQHPRDECKASLLQRKTMHCTFYIAVV